MSDLATVGYLVNVDLPKERSIWLSKFAAQNMAQKVGGIACPVVYRASALLALEAKNDALESERKVSEIGKEFYDLVVLERNLAHVQLDRRDEEIEKLRATLTMKEIDIAALVGVVGGLQCKVKELEQDIEDEAREASYRESGG